MRKVILGERQNVVVNLLKISRVNKVILNQLNNRRLI